MWKECVALCLEDRFVFSGKRDSFSKANSKKLGDVFVHNHLLPILIFIQLCGISIDAEKIAELKIRPEGGENQVGR